jgi:hypothetical protein
MQRTLTMLLLPLLPKQSQISKLNWLLKRLKENLKPNKLPPLPNSKKKPCLPRKKQLVLRPNRQELTRQSRLLLPKLSKSNLNSWQRRLRRTLLSLLLNMLNN